MNKRSQKRQTPATDAAPANLKATASAADAAAALREQSKHDISSDTQGSYTGTPEDGGQPVQDADDL